MASEATEDGKVEGVGGHNGQSPDHARRELEEEFNMQRAKMKELFLHKEEDMRKIRLEKEQLESEVLGLRAELDQQRTLSENQLSEIQSLQLLVNETVDASSSGTEEVRRLRARTLELEQQLNLLKQQQQEVSLAPATLVRSLARKLVPDDQDAGKKGAEEAEVARSILLMETEISSLKDKLRNTDAQLQEALKANAAAVSAAPGSACSTESKSETESPRRCAMCANYEKQLVGEQARADAARDRAHALELSLHQATQELEGVRSLHDETVTAWHASRAATAERLGALGAAVHAAQATLAARAAAADAASQRALHRVTLLTVDRDTLQAKLDSLERDNAMLVGKYVRHSQELQNEMIDLPHDVQELQELALQLREQLIFCQVGREEAVGLEAALRGQLAEQGQLLHRSDTELVRAREELSRLQAERDQSQQLAEKLRLANDVTERLLEDKKRLQSEAAEVRARVSVLQQELDNSEKVQQDFVRLSQSLQVQLQRIREADTEVRWQWEEDVSECPGCRTPLPARRKTHCRHCGRVFCVACASHAVPAGPRRREAKVCAVCRTLLQPHTAPYFSTAPPHSPD